MSDSYSDENFPQPRLVAVLDPCWVIHLGFGGLTNDKLVHVDDLLRPDTPHSDNNEETRKKYKQMRAQLGRTATNFLDSLIYKLEELGNDMVSKVLRDTEMETFKIPGRSVDIPSRQWRLSFNISNPARDQRSISLQDEKKRLEVYLKEATSFCSPDTPKIWIKESRKRFTTSEAGEDFFGEVGFELLKHVRWFITETWIGSDEETNELTNLPGFLYKPASANIQALSTEVSPGIDKIQKDESAVAAPKTTEDALHN